MTSIARSFREPSPVLGRDRLARAYLLTLGLVCFFPYPGLPVGNRTGLQMGEILALIGLPLILFDRPTRALYAFLLIMIPYHVSSAVVAARGLSPEPDVIPKELFSFHLALCVLLPSPWLARRDQFGRLLACAAAAILTHTAVGMIQVYAFSQSEFPLLFLYRNRSFKSMASWAETYALYVKRPCGLFPEPSAMAASLGPWLVVMAGVLTDPALLARFGARGAFRRWVALALFGGLLLMTLSRSGLTPIVALAMVTVVVWQTLARPWLHGSPVGSKGVATGLTVALVVLGAFGYVVVSTLEGLDSRVESSWGLRAQSLVTAVQTNNEPVGLLVGVGPGQSTETLRKQLAGLRLSEGQDDFAVWSVSVCYYMEVGGLGALAMLLVLGMTLSAIWASSARVLGLAAFGVWCAGVTITTSYSHLASLWLFLGVLLEWDRLFSPAGNPGSARSLARPDLDGKRREKKPPSAPTQGL